MTKLVYAILSIALISTSALAQQRTRLNVIGDVAVLNMLYEGKAVDVKKLVAVSTVAGTNTVRIERTTLPGSLNDSIRLIIPTTACERLPAYVVFRDQQLYFFLDESKRRITHNESVCDKFEISYPLNYFNLDAAEYRNLNSGLVIPKPIVTRPFEFLETQDITGVTIPTDLEGSYVLSILKKDSKITSATLSVRKSLGQDNYIIQTLP